MTFTFEKPTEITFLDTEELTLTPEPGDIVIALNGLKLGKEAVIETFKNFDGVNNALLTYDTTCYKMPRDPYGECKHVGCEGGTSDSVIPSELSLLGTLPRTFNYTDPSTDELIAYEEVRNVWTCHVESEIYALNKLLDRSYLHYREYLIDQVRAKHHYKAFRSQVADLSVTDQLTHDNLYSRADLPIGKSDPIACSIFTAYDNNKKIILYKNTHLNFSGYEYLTSDGWTLRSKEDFDRFIKAYNLDEDTIRETEDHIYIEPNIKVDEWSPIEERFNPRNLEANNK